MKQKKPDISDLKNYLNGNCSTDKKLWVENWLDKSPEMTDLLYTLSIQQETFPDKNSKQRIKARLLSEIEDDISNQKASIQSLHLSGKRSNRNNWLRVAAVLVFCVLSGILIYSQFMLHQDEPQLVMKETISPSMTITSVTLSDNSKILLNANSTLRYPATFSVEERLIYLEGEAFIDVAHYKNWPFKVITGEVTTTVLGTKFNVFYQPEQEKIEVSLQEGKVLVTNNEDTSHSVRNEIVLNPDEWVSYSFMNQNFTVYKGLGNKLLWKDKILEFEGLTLTEVVRKLERWYGVSIHFEESEAQNCTVVGTFQNEPLENVLKGLQFVVGINYDITEDSVKLSGGGCN